MECSTVDVHTYSRKLNYYCMGMLCIQLTVKNKHWYIRNIWLHICRWSYQIYASDSYGVIFFTVISFEIDCNGGGGGGGGEINSAWKSCWCIWRAVNSSWLFYLQADSADPSLRSCGCNYVFFLPPPPPQSKHWAALSKTFHLLLCNRFFITARHNVMIIHHVVGKNRELSFRANMLQANFVRIELISDVQNILLMSINQTDLFYEKIPINFESYDIK